MLIARLSCVVLAASASTFAAPCSGRMIQPTAVVVRDTARLRHWLLEELKHQAPSISGEIDAAARAIRITSLPSAVVPGGRYHWAAYAPLGESDVIIEAVVATLPGDTVPLRVPSDWARFAGRAAWRPDTPARATAACAEVVTVTGPVRSSILSPVLFSDSSILQRPEIFGRLRLANRLTPPVVTSRRDGWVVRAWFLEMGRSTRYTCEIENGNVDLTELEQIMAAGLPRLGP